MTDTERLSPETVRAQQMRGEALLVCAYDDPKKCEQSALTGSITLEQLEQRLPTGKRLVFY